MIHFYNQINAKTFNYILLDHLKKSFYIFLDTNFKNFGIVILHKIIILSYILKIDD